MKNISTIDERTSARVFATLFELQIWGNTLTKLHSNCIITFEYCGTSKHRHHLKNDPDTQGAFILTPSLHRTVSTLLFEY